MKINRLLLMLIPFVLVACGGKGCGQKDTASDAAADAASEAKQPLPPQNVPPLPPPENDLTEVTITDKASGAEATFKIGDKVTVKKQIGMINERFNGVAPVVVEPPHAGEITAIRTPEGLVDVRWEAGTWRKYVAPDEAKPGEPAAAADLAKPSAPGENVELGEFTSPVHASYLVQAGAADAAPAEPAGNE